MNSDGLCYLTHTIDGKLYGAWFRLLSSRELEVFGVGFLQKTTIGSSDPETTARAVLEEFVRQRLNNAEPVPALN